MKSWVLSILALALIAGTFCAPASAAEYLFHFLNSARGPLTVQIKGTECMIRGAGPVKIADKAVANLFVETDQSGPCAVLHRPSKIEIVITGTGGQWMNSTCEKWALKPFACTRSDAHGLRALSDKFQDGGMFVTILEH